MTDRELKKLSRADLLELLLEQMKENERLSVQLKETREKLQKKELDIQNAGSIAQASLQLNGVFEAAQAACDQYLENIKRLHDEQIKTCEQIERATQRKCRQILAEAERLSLEYRKGLNQKTQLHEEPPPSQENA